MNVASVAEVKAHLSAFLKASERSPVVVTRNGKPVAVIISLRDPDDIERLRAISSPHLRDILDKSLDEIRKGRGLPHEQFWTEVESQTAGKGRRQALRTRKPRLS